MFDEVTTTRLRNTASLSDVDLCVGGTKVNKSDAAFKGKLDGKFTKFYILCNLKN